MNLYFTYVSRDTLKSLTLFITVKSLEHSDKFETEIQKISRRVSRSPDNAEFGHFNVVVLQRTAGRQRDVSRANTRAQALFFRCRRGFPKDPSS